jgi:hypothetical protein
MNVKSGSACAMKKLPLAAIIYPKKIRKVDLEQQNTGISEMSDVEMEVLVELIREISEDLAPIQRDGD